MNEKQRINLGYGLMCLILGTFWLLYTMELLPWRISNYMLSWRFLLMVVGTAILIKSRRNFIGLLSLGAGVAFSITQFITLPEGWETYLPPIALIIVGAILLLKPSGDRKKFDTQNNQVINEATILHKSTYKISSLLFKGGYITSILGKNTIDLTKTHLACEEVLVETTCVMGKICIIVPENWNIKINTNNILGSSYDNRLILQAPSNIEGTLTISGTVFMGNIEVCLVESV